MKSRFAFIAPLLFSAMTLLFASGVSAQAQVPGKGAGQGRVDDFQQSQEAYRKAYDAFKTQRQADFEAWRKQRNEEYVKFLKQTWEKEDSKEAVKPQKETPVVPPAYLPDIEPDPEDKEVDVDVIDVVFDFPDPAPVPKIAYKPSKPEKALSFQFYGTDATIHFDPSQKVSLTDCKEAGVADFWSALSSGGHEGVLRDCLAAAERMDLCDWAYYKLCEQAAAQLYKGNEATLFHAWLLTQSGFCLRLGRANDRIYLLPSTEEIIFRTSYFVLSDKKYYVIDKDNESRSMHIIGQDFKGTRPMRLRQKNGNRLSFRPSAVKTRKTERNVKTDIVCNENMIAFLGDYPSFGIAGTQQIDWVNCCNTPLSDEAKTKLYTQLKERIKGMNELEAANLLLNYVQIAFEYKTDDEVWGRERAFFPEETLYYPYCDCEDRAILFSRLVSDLLGLEAILVHYPGHLATAVHFNTDVKGDYFEVDGKRYIVCDPTFFNAPVGKTMTTMDNRKATVYRIL